MEKDIIVAAFALFGTMFGTGGGILMSNKLTAYRIEQLEKKVDKHNCIIERTYKIEEKLSIHEEMFKVGNHRIADLEGELK